MPRFNRTGPMGQGPMTGGGKGFCFPYPRGFFRRGLRISPGFRFRKCWNYPIWDPIMNKPWRYYYDHEPTEYDLKNQIEMLKADREMIDKMIKDIENKLTGEKINENSFINYTTRYFRCLY